VPDTVEFAGSVEDHLRALTARDRTTALAAIERQLSHEPLKETRNRKPLRPNPIAPLELRVGNLRVFYEVTASDTGWCGFWRWGEKWCNVLTIGGKEIRP